MNIAPRIPIINTTGQPTPAYPTLLSSTVGTTAVNFLDNKLAYNPAAGMLSVNNLQYKSTGTTNNFLPRSAQRYIASPTTQAFTAQQRQAVADFHATITPRSINSKIFITVRWMGEYGNDNYVYNSMWGLARNGSIIGPAVNPGVRVWGIQTATLSYNAVDNNSTPETMNFTYLDSPGTIEPCTYQVIFLSYVNITLYTNRTVGDIDSNSYERGTSCLTLVELA